MKLKRKNLAMMTVFVCLFVFISIGTVSAQTIKYDPIAVLPNIAPEGGTIPSIEEYLKNIFVFALGIAAILSVIQIIIGGIAYMTSEIGSSINDAKDRIRSAILGLLLILSTYLILNQINPDILNLRLGSQIPPAQTSPDPSGPQGPTQSNTGNEGAP